MEIVGGGFLAQSLRSLAHRYPDAVVFAAGVSSGQGAVAADFDRDAALVYETVERCRRAGTRLVYFSTSSVGMYGTQVAVGREDGPVFPTSPYGRHKLAMESVIAHAAIDHLILRLAYPVGPAQRPHQFLPSLVAQVRTGTVRVHRGARRDLIDVADVVTLVDALLDLRVTREVVNIASGTAVPVDQIVDHIERRLGTVTRRELVDVPAEPEVSVAKLRHLARCADGMGFGVDYFHRVIDRYLGVPSPDPATAVSGGAPGAT